MLDGRAGAVCHIAADRHAGSDGAGGGGAGGGGVGSDLVHSHICAYEHQDDECVVRHSLQ